MSDLDKKAPILDAIEWGTRAGIANLVPVLGHAIDAAWHGHTNARWANRFKAVVEGIEVRVQQLEGVSEEYLRSDEFADLLAETLASAARLENEEVRQMYASTVVAAAQRGPGSQVPARRVIARLERLTPEHFRFLKGLSNGSSLVRPEDRVRSISQFIDTVYERAVSHQGRQHGVPTQASYYFDDLRLERLIHSDNRDLDQRDRAIMMTFFEPRQAIDWITWQAKECLQYIWPEDFS